MPIYIAHDYDGTKVDIVLARSYELAQVYWQGKGVIAHSVTEFNEASLTDHPTGVLPILNTVKKSLSSCGSTPRDYYVVTKK